MLLSQMVHFRASQCSPRDNFASFQQASTIAHLTVDY